MNEKVLEILDAAIGGQLSISVWELDKYASLFDYGLDSIGFINIIINLEKQYDIFIDQYDMLIEQFSTIHNIIDYLQTKCVN